MKDPGFERCRVIVFYQGNRYDGLASAAFDPDLIKPTEQFPSDFNQFWDKAKKELASVPIDVKLTLLPDRCTEKTNVYEANIQNYKNTRIFGILCLPKKPGKYPALLEVPGAGVRPYYGDIASADRGIITFQIGIHGIPVTLDPLIYNELGRTALNGYSSFNLDDRDTYYFKRVYLGCIRAIDYIFSLPEFDGSNLAVIGGSQGGALSIVSAGLDQRVKYIAVSHPALCDLTGYLSNRAGGWPHVFRNKEDVTKEKLNTAMYYDVVNFARNVKIPGYNTWGYNDSTCPPTSTYSAYNVIPGPKELVLYQETGHWSFPEQAQLKMDWIINRLKENK
jgi:cephalosporin-C deacetylase-like acetyl esterase